MSEDNNKSLKQPQCAGPEDPLGSPEELAALEIPEGVDRRAFLMRNSLIAFRCGPVPLPDLNFG